jgi:hypothetical protein
MLHDSARVKVAAALSLTLPDLEAELQKTMPVSKWNATLTLRELDLLRLHWLVAKELAAVDPAVVSFVWDLTNNIWYGCSKNSLDAGTAGCFLRTHLNYVTTRQRPLLGYEQMVAQDFDESMILTDSKSKETVTDDDLKHMSGDTMTIRVMGAMSMLALAGVDFWTPTANPDVSAALIGVKQGQQIGEYKFNVATEWDIVFSHADSKDARDLFGKGKAKAKTFVSHKHKPQKPPIRATKGNAN